MFDTMLLNYLTTYQKNEKVRDEIHSTRLQNELAALMKIYKEEIEARDKRHKEEIDGRDKRHREEIEARNKKHREEIEARDKKHREEIEARDNIFKNILTNINEKFDKLGQQIKGML